MAATAGRRFDGVNDTTDGRRLRAARNRDAVVVALLEIIEAQGGGPAPGAAEVAERAGVSERTVFRHFADLDSLFLAAAAHQRPKLESYLSPRPDARELDKRIAAIARLRSRLYTEIAPVRRVAAPLAGTNEVLARMLDGANRAGRKQLAEVFGAEIAKAGRSRQLLLDELELATSWAAWEHLRSAQGDSPERARRTMTDLLTTLLTPYSGRRPSTR